MIIRSIILLLLAGFAASVHAQQSSNNGRFSITQKKGCNPLTITVNAPECTSNFSCSANFGTGTFVSIVDGDTFTYTTAGNYTLTIIFSTTGTDQINLQVRPNVQPEFDLYACGGNGVQVRVTDNNYDQYIVNFNDGTEVTVAANTPVSHVYASAGSKNVTVRGRYLNAEDNCSSLTKSVNVLGTLPTPTITQLTVLDNASIQLDFNTLPNVLYRLQIGANNGTSFQPLQNVYNTTSVTLPNLRPDDNYYCFRLGVVDPCNNSISYSNIICSANFDLTIQNNNNRLHWATSTAGNLSNFSIYKTPGTITGASSITTEYNDGDVRCGTEYKYQLQSNYPNGSRSISLIKTGTAISNDVPSTINNVSAVVNGDNVSLLWLQDQAFTPKEYVIFKSSNGNFTPYGSSLVTSFTDTEYSADGGFCYQLQYSDVCDNQSLVSDAICPIQLTATLAGNNTITLTWTEYNGWANGVSNYRIEKYDAKSNLLETIDAGTNTSYIEENNDFLNQVFTYRIIAYPSGIFIAPSVSNSIMVIKEPNLFHPTAFTPNADGLNDVFLVYSQYTASFEMKIFNRWGELLFMTNDLETAWDGTFKGNRMPEGTYVYKATITDFAGRTFNRSGTVLLLKK